MAEPIELLPGADWTNGVTDPTAVAGMPEAVYHADPIPDGSLSSTGVRKLLRPGCPAKFRWWLDHPEEHNPVFEFGSAAHHRVLGTGPELVEVEADNWLTKAAKGAREEARERGAVALLTKELTVVDEMAEAISQHPIAGPLLHGDGGVNELSLFWRDRTVWGRARLDRLTWIGGRRRPVIVDYKTCASAAPEDVEKAIARFGYHVQGAHYVAGARALGLGGEDIGFLLVMQEKEAPYLVTVVEPDSTAMRMGAIRVRQAFDLFAECHASGVWPGYADDVVLAELPPWETRELEGTIL